MLVFDLLSLFSFCVLSPAHPKFFPFPIFPIQLLSNFCHTSIQCLYYLCDQIEHCLQLNHILLYALLSCHIELFVFRGVNNCVYFFLFFNLLLFYVLTFNLTFTFSAPCLSLISRHSNISSTLLILFSQRHFSLTLLICSFMNWQPSLPGLAAFQRFPSHRSEDSFYLSMCEDSIYPWNVLFFCFPLLSWFTA